LVEAVREYGWRDREFKAIIDEALAPERDVIITDISSPPGPAKTRNTLKYAVERRRPLIASFPTHTNQEQALEYIIEFLEEEKPRRLPFFVFDYAGVENYCIFYRPEALMKFLDMFKEGGRGSYAEAVENFLGHPVVTAILLQRGLNIDEIWLEVGEALDEYARTGDRRRFLSRMREVVEKKGQYEVCRGVCPVGLLFWRYRRQVYQDLAGPKVITWRRERAEAWREKYPRAGRHIVVAHPDNCVEGFGELLEGNYRLEGVLCPRLLLISKATLAGRDKKPNYIAVRRSMILVPHAGLRFVISVVRREHEVQGLQPRHILFIDEYDAFIRPRRWKLFSLSALAALIAVADSVIRAGVGGRVGGFYVDEYLHRYAEYVEAVASKVRDVVEAAIKGRVYHPLVNLFTEGAFSLFEERVLKPATKAPEKLVYEALSPRPVHIKHFAGDDLLPLIMNERVFFADLAAGDPEWRVNLRAAKIAFSKLASGVRVLELRPHVMRGQGGNVLTLRRRKVRRNLHTFMARLREYLQPLLDYPRYAVYYVLAEDGDVELVSVDAAIYTLLGLRGILTSASPILWNYLVSGPRPGFSTSLYVSLVNDGAVSTVQVKAVPREEFFDKEVRKYEVVFNVYSRDAREKLEEAVAAGAPVPELGVEQKRGVIRQVSVLSTMAREYSKLLQVHYSPGLPPLYIPPPRVGRDERRAVVEMIKDSLAPYINHIRYLAGHAKEGKYLLLLVQNKFYARILARLAGAIPCHREFCGEHVRKPTHFSSGQIDITWFRSRAERGIDLPHEYSVVLVVGSPYPKPGYIAGGTVEPSEFTTAISQGLQYDVRTYNARAVRRVSVAHTPYDILSGISVLAQSLGRATRSVMRTGEPVKVVMPAFLKHKVMVYAPLWLKMAG